MATILFMANPTDEHLEGVPAGYIDLSATAARPIATWDEALAVLIEWIERAKLDDDPNNIEVYGEFPPILRAVLSDENDDYGTDGGHILMWTHEVHGSPDPFPVEWVETGFYRFVKSEFDGGDDADR